LPLLTPIIQPEVFSFSVVSMRRVAA